MFWSCSPLHPLRAERQIHPACCHATRLPADENANPAAVSLSERPVRAGWPPPDRAMPGVQREKDDAVLVETRKGSRDRRQASPLRNLQKHRARACTVRVLPKVLPATGQARWPALLARRCRPLPVRTSPRITTVTARLAGSHPAEGSRSAIPRPPCELHGVIQLAMGWEGRRSAPRRSIEDRALVVRRSPSLMAWPAWDSSATKAYHLAH
jgi:hypothetical protein